MKGYNVPLFTVSYTALCFTFMPKLKVCVTFYKFGGGNKQRGNTFLKKLTQYIASRMEIFFPDFNSWITDQTSIC